MTRVFYNRKNVIEWEESCLEELPLPYPGTDWRWDIAPRPEAERDYSIVHLVRGIPDLHQAIEQAGAPDLERSAPPH